MNNIGAKLEEARGKIFHENNSWITSIASFNVRGDFLGYDGDPSSYVDDFSEIRHRLEHKRVQSAWLSDSIDLVDDKLRFINDDPKIAKHFHFNDRVMIATYIEDNIVLIFKYISAERIVYFFVAKVDMLNGCGNINDWLLERLAKSYVNSRIELQYPRKPNAAVPRGGNNNVEPDNGELEMFNSSP